jgi:hypothetical protein
MTIDAATRADYEDGRAADFCKTLIRADPGGPSDVSPDG